MKILNFNIEIPEDVKKILNIVLNVKEQDVKYVKENIHHQLMDLNVQKRI